MQLCFAVPIRKLKIIYVPTLLRISIFAGHSTTISEIAKRQLSLKSPLMPTSCSTTLGTDIVNLHYSLPPDLDGPDTSNTTTTNQSISLPIAIPTLTPIIQNKPEVSGLVQLPTNVTSAELMQWSNPAVVNVGDLTSATPPMTCTPTELINADQHRLSEEEFYGEDTINSNLDMALYSPLPHLQFNGGQVPTLATPIEDWIKQPNTTLTLNSDALMTSLSTADSPTTTVFSEGTLPPFSQSLGQSTTDGLYISSEGGFSLPPLENTLNFENVDLKDLPS